MALAPRDEQDLAAVIAGAAKNRTPLAVGGAGTKAAMGRPA
jgi:FAD/FMN-containing dehydrogenase